MKSFFKTILSPFYLLAKKLFGGKQLRRNPIVNRIYMWIAPFVRNDYVEINGYKLHLDALDGIEVGDDGFERTTTEFLKTFLKEGHTVVDIGADIGYYTFLAAHAVGASGKVFAFEPNPITFRILQKNNALNGYSNVALVGSATGDAKGEMPFYEHGPHSSMGYDRFNDGKPSRMVPVVRLDDYLSSDTPVDVLKIDIEGSEPRAFRGMQRILGNPNLTIVFEFYPKLMRMAGEDPAKHLAMLESMGYKFYDLNREGMKTAISAKELLARYPEQEGMMSNIVGKRT